jgi:hypothetical protein
MTTDSADLPGDDEPESDRLMRERLRRLTKEWRRVLTQVRARLASNDDP